MTASWDGPGIAGLSRFEVIGRGGFSVVYKAWQEGLERPVAVKVLLADLSDPDDARRFRRECAVLGTLGLGRHVVDVYDAGITRDRRPYIVMRYYPVGTLGTRLRDEGPLQVEQAVQMLADLAGAVQSGHDHGVIHRDIKPDNVLIDDDGQMVLADFGVSALIDDEGAAGTRSVAYSEAYAAPEVLDSNAYGTASDVYSLAATGYAMLTGQAPFGSTSGAQRLLAVMTQPPAPITASGVPQGLAEEVVAGMAKDPGDRPRTPLLFAERLRSALTSGSSHITKSASPETHRQTPPSPAFCSSCGALLTGSGAYCPGCGHSQHPAVSDRTTIRASADANDVPRLPEQSLPAQPIPHQRLVPWAWVAALVILVFGIASVVYVFGIRPARTATESLAQPVMSPSPTHTEPAAPETSAPTTRVTKTVTAPPPRREPTEAATEDPPPTVCTFGSSGQPNPDYPFSSLLSTTTADTSDSRIRTAVSSIQEVLRAAGYKNRVGGPVLVDGIFGPATAFSVREFQADNGLTVDGKVGPETWRALAGFC